jgi:hypothetical protein
MSSKLNRNSNLHRVLETPKIKDGRNDPNHEIITLLSTSSTF